MKKAPVLVPVLLAVLAHGALVALMFLEIDFDDKPKLFKSSASAAKPQIVETVMVDNKKVADLVKKIKQKKKKQADKQKALKKRLAQLESKRKKEEQRSKNASAKRKKDEKLAKEAEAKRKKEKKLADAAEVDRKEKETQADIAAQKLAEEKKRVEDAKIKRQQDELERTRQEEFEQQMLAEQTAMDEEQHQYIMSEKDKYTKLIVERVKSQMVMDLTVTLQIKLMPGGTVFEITCLEGDPIPCKAAEVAVRKAEPLPVPKDLDVFNEIRTLNLNFDKLIPGGL